MNKMRFVEMYLQKTQGNCKDTRWGRYHLNERVWKYLNYFSSLSVPWCNLTSEIVNKILGRTIEYRQKEKEISFARV